MHQLRPLTLLLVLTALGCDCGDPRFGLIGDARVFIETPESEAVVFSEDALRFSALGESQTGIDWVALRVGDVEVARCTPDNEKGHDGHDEPLRCETEFVPSAYAAQELRGRLRLTAQARANNSSVMAESSIEVIVRSSPATLVIESPAADSTVSSEAAVVLRARWTSPVATRGMTLHIGAAELARCDAQTPAQEFECEASFLTTDHAASIVDGKLRLAARATDIRGESSEAFIHVDVEAIRVRFVEPVLTQQTPPLALVQGAGALEVDVASSVPVTRVSITSEDGVLLHTFEHPPYVATVHWGQLLGTGEHRILARAIDANGQMDVADRLVQVRCGADTDCASGTRCCLDTGTCNPIVGPGADCDCERPCPEDQGCFPGTCGAAPRRCRPGCFPGSRDVRADRCGAEDGRPAYCVRLPANEATPENHGGACAPADSCDIGLQNCPDLPLDRTRPVGPDNPAISQSCVPGSPTTNHCIPAGGLPVGAQNCTHGVCTADYSTVSCVKGALCVVTVDTSGNPTGPASCRQQCTNPAPVFPTRRECPSGKLCYGGLQGPGREAYPSGTCE